MTEFNFDDSEFDANAFDESLLDMQAGLEIDDTFMSFDDPNEIHTNVSLRSKSAEEIASEVEATLLDFLASGDHEAILSLTGENHGADNFVEAEVASNFSAAYTQAAMYNPAIRWYSKLAKMLPAEKFSVSDGNLNLKMGEALFKKAVIPFLGDFKAELQDDSPIVALIYSLANSIKDQAVQDQLERASEQEGSKADPGQMDLGDVDMADGMFDTEDVQVGEVTVDDNGGFGTNQVDRVESPGISLLDLANKTIAEHFIDNDQVDPGFVQQKLIDEGFARARINEILGIIKFIRLNNTMEARSTPTGNRGAGDIDFDFM